MLPELGARGLGYRVLDEAPRLQKQMRKTFYLTSHSYILAAREVPHERAAPQWYSKQEIREYNSKIFGEVLAPWTVEDEDDEDTHN